MRIALIAPPWLPVPPPAYGGTESVIDGLARGLAAAGHDVFLYATGDSTTPVERAAYFPRALGVGRQDPESERRHVEAAYRHPAVRGPTSSTTTRSSARRTAPSPRERPS